jgi:hypothetical protein
MSQHRIDFIGGSLNGSSRYVHGPLSDGLTWMEPNGERYIYVADFDSFLFHVEGLPPVTTPDQPVSDAEMERVELKEQWMREQ